MTADKRGRAMVIIGSGILDGEDHNWDCMNARSATSGSDRLIQPKSTGYAAVVKELGKWAFRGGSEHHIDPFCVHKTVNNAQRANITL